MAVVLTKELADALCTAIAVGFIKSTNDSKNKLAIQYSDSKDANEIDKYTRVKKFLDDIISPSFDLSASVAQSTVPFIVAQTPKYPNIVASANVLKGEFETYLASINSGAANTIASGKTLYGAYIGACLANGSLNVFGPSDIKTYESQYRAFVAGEQETINTAYKRAVATSETIKPILTGALKGTATKVMTNTMALNQSSVDNMGAAFSAKAASSKKTQLFKSVHGMTLAIDGSAINNDGVIFEIALGADTSKVSSCLPCSMFMCANGTPPTSIHLGKGDNWNIPDNLGSKLSYLVPKWKESIKSYYTSGVDLMKRSSIKTACDNAKILDTKMKDGADKISDIFLEALTYEGSFTDKIINTFTNAITS